MVITGSASPRAYVHETVRRLLQTAKTSRCSDVANRQNIHTMKQRDGNRVYFPPSQREIEAGKDVGGIYIAYRRFAVPSWQ